MNKPYNRLKFGGSVALLLSIVGVLLAIGGQLDFIGQDRPDTRPVVVTPATISGKQPKYSFYEDLKKRKTEVDASVQPKVATQKTRNSNQSTLNEVYRYKVQVGAFSKKNDANKIRQRAELLGFAVTVVKSGSKYLTQVGPFTGMTAAKAAEKKLIAAKLPTLIRRIK